MADEQTPQSDLIDDAIRQAERQLEEKLEALRMSALGEPTPSDSPADDDVAVLRPTGGARSHSQASHTGTSAGERAEAPGGDVAWYEAGDDDELRFRPAEGSATLRGNELYVPDEEPAFDEVPHELISHEPPAEQAEPAHGTLSASVTDLTPVWEDVASLREVEPAPHHGDGEQEPPARPEPAAASPLRGQDDDPWETPEPVHTTWTGNARTPQAPAQPQSVVSLPSDDELQFWAQTRTALRTLHQLTSGIPGQVSGDLSGEVQRIVQEELTPTENALHSVHQQLQQQLPKLHDRIEHVVDEAMAAPNSALRQLRDELPAQLDRSTRALHEALREELDHASAAVHGAVQKDVAQLEQSIATNVTRMAHGTVDSVSRVERDVTALGEGVVRLERGVQGEFDRVETQLRAAIERVEQAVREEAVQPAETLRKLDEELPARFGRIERTLLEQVQTTQRELSTVLMSLVDANRASLDRIAALGSTMDEERARRSEDVEIVVDTVTTGWEGLAGAMKALFEQGEENSRRIAGIEQRLAQIRDLEGGVEATMTELRSHVRDLQPAPIMVTVSHPDAEVSNSARGGWLPASKG